MEYFLQQLVNGLAVGCLYALIALGYTMVYGVLRLINFAHGDVFMVGAFAGAYTARALTGGKTEQTFLQAGLGIVVAVIVCAVLGWAIERFAYRPLRRSSKLAALITAIGVSLLIENLANIEWRFGGHRWFGSTPTLYPTITGWGEPVQWIKHLFGVSVVWKDLLLLATTALVLAILWYIVRMTRRGKAMRALAQNYDASRLMGIHVDAVVSFTFMLGSALAAVGGCLFCIKNPQATPTMGIIIGLKAFVAAVVGGIGNIPGAAVGGLLLGLTETMVSSMGGSRYENAIAFVILILVLLLKPEGIFGRAVPEKV
jgi:branched-chain amino acid transport system permease protein